MYPQSERCLVRGRAPCQISQRKIMAHHQTTISLRDRQVNKDSETTFTQVCRLYEQSQQQHQEMMNQFINMGNHHGQYQQKSKLSELLRTRPPTFSHTDKPLEADDWL